jgi:glycerophosphoryl diester phosphodiesterase
MLKIEMILLFFVAVFSFTLEAMAGSRIYLTHYTIQSSTDAIGEVKSRSGKVLRVQLEGKDAAFFSVGQDNVLRVNKNLLSGAQSRFEIVVRATLESGQLSEPFIVAKDDFVKNRVVAHRGAWKNTGAPENSLAALRQAVKLGCEGSEFDVHMTADSVPVVNHDNAVQAVSIARTQSSELLKLQLSNGEPLPTLSAYLTAGMEQMTTRLVLEIKTSELGKEHSLALTRKVIELVESHRAQAWVDYIAFDFDVCREVVRLAPYARVAYLNGDKTPDELAAEHFFGLDYHFKVLQKNPGWIEDAHLRNLTVNVWTVNDTTLMKELLDKKVEFITTNEPEELLKLVK